MDVKNIMIGDYYHLICGNKDGSDAIVRVKTVYERGHCSVTGSDMYTEVAPHTLFPIFLSSKILYNNGFKNRKPELNVHNIEPTFVWTLNVDNWRIELEYNYNVNEDVDFYIININDGQHQHITKYINNVHELQHIFRLFNINKEIKL